MGRVFGGYREATGRLPGGYQGVPWGYRRVQGGLQWVPGGIGRFPEATRGYQEVIRRSPGWPSAEVAEDALVILHR